MSFIGWSFLIVAWTSVTFLVFYTITKVLREERKVKENNIEQKV